MKKSLNPHLVLGVYLAGSLLLTVRPLQAKYIGAEPPKCPTCSCNCGPNATSQKSDTTTTLSRTEGNLTESIPITSVRSSSGSTLDLSFTYNTYNADGSRATVDTIAGYGWTHSYNV